MPLRILIVDDNRDAADSLGVLVELFGHTAVVAYDAQAGLRAAARDRPDCLILDINMPGTDGLTLARLVRQQAGMEQVKLMAVSANSGTEYVQRVEAAGFDYRLTKPADPAEIQRLLAMIENIQRLAEQTEQLARRNVSLAERTEAAAARSESLAGETKELLREVKEELRDVKQDVREIKDELKEVKDKVDKQSDGEDWKTDSGGDH